MDYTLHPAQLRDREELLALYRGNIGRPGCTWSENYPSPEDLDRDLAEHRPFCWRAPDGALAGAATLIPGGEEDARDKYHCWDPRAKNPCELCRVGVSPQAQGRGVATAMVRRVLEEARALGFDWAQLLVSPGNPPAVALYRRVGFVKCGEADLYGLHWWCMELELASYQG